jgi:TolB-like protein/tetratricopeptide (TPR) repeat protein
MAEVGGGEKASGSTPPVFISYASQDAAVAAALVEALERHGIACWIAPRDVKAGALYADAIVRAISGAKAFVLVLSESAIASSHVSKEIERASSKKRPIIALRMDAAPLTPALEYFLSESQWVEAQAGNIDAACVKLIDAIREPVRGAPETPVAVPPGTSAGAASAVHPKSRRNWILLVAGIALVAALAALVDKFWPAKHAAAEEPATPATNVVSDKSIAVLPFTDMSEKKDQEYFGDGMAEEIINLLAKVPDLKVIGRTSSFQFRGKQLDARSIGTVLGVAHLLEGSVRRSGTAVRVTAQLLSTRDGAHEWSETYETTFDDVLKVQDEIAASLARALEIAVGDVQIPVARTVNPAAYDLFLKGMYALDLFTKEGCDEAIGLFTQALQIDPKFAPAAGGIAWAYDHIGQNGWLPTELAFQRARTYALRALEIDPKLGAAHTALAGIYLVYDWDWAAAQREIDTAFALGGRNSAGLTVAGRVASATDPGSERAASLLHEAIALDPLNAEAHIVLGYWVYARTGRFVEAERSIRRGLQISPNWGSGHYFLAIDLLMLGRLDKATEEAKKETSQDGQFEALSEIYHAQHRESDSDAALDQAIRINADNWAAAIAMVYAFRGEADHASQWLGRAYAQHDEELYLIKGDPQLRNIEGDPRYKAFLRKMNLPE